MMRESRQGGGESDPEEGWGGGLVPFGRVHVSGGRVSAASVFSWSVAARLRAPGAAIATLAVLALLLVSSSPPAPPPAEFGGPEGSGAGEFLAPSGAAVDQATGDLYVVDRNNNRVEEFGPNGEFLLAFGCSVKEGAG